ncbi:TetR family transcriptional regulator [Desulfosarcina sp. OttesenSCG-928-G17]|nr:TetR family transcriptional regulator [Desulfosarcina sp. OttesenSCG-928-G17]
MNRLRKSKSGDTKTRILDTAEVLFAQKGFRQTSISQLARHAKVNLAAVNYHFGSKNGLMEALLERRLFPVHQLRMERLTAIQDEMRTEGQVPEAAELISAFVEPAFSLTREADGGKNFMMIASRLMSEPGDNMRPVFIRNFIPAFVLLFELMQKSLPQVAEDDLLWRLHFVLGALSHAMRVHGTTLPPDMFPVDRTPETMTRLLVDFLTAGMQSASQPLETGTQNEKRR